LAVINGKRKLNKYNAKRITIDGYKFDSLREGARYEELKILVYANQITDLKIHPKYELVPKFIRGDKTHQARYYISDFEYIEDGYFVTEDVKGVITKLASWKMNQFEFQYPIRVLRIVK